MGGGKNYSMPSFFMGEGRERNKGGAKCFMIFEEEEAGLMREPVGRLCKRLNCVFLRERDDFLKRGKIEFLGVIKCG